MNHIYTIAYAIMHFLEDGICALALSGKILKHVGLYPHGLAYLACAYGLQLPFGYIADRAAGGRSIEVRERIYTCICYLGMMLTIAGAFFSPILLGIGSALFHCGGGMGTIAEEQQLHRRGWPIGLFTAPGILGAYVGGILPGKRTLNNHWIIIAVCCILMLICSLVLEIAVQVRSIKNRKGGVEVRFPDIYSEKSSLEQKIGRIPLFLFVLAGCMIAAFLDRQIAFEWESYAMAGMLSVAMMAAGNLTGGLCLTRFGSLRTLFAATLLAAAFYSCGRYLIAGLLGRMALHMMMPLMIYVLTEQFTHRIGTCWGVVYLGILLGQLPGRLRVVPDLSQWADPALIGSMGCLIVLMVLLIPVSRIDRD